MATKDDMTKQVKKLQKQNLELKKNNDFLFTQQKELKRHAEDAGSKCAKIEHQLIVLQDKYDRIAGEQE